MNQLFARMDIVVGAGVRKRRRGVVAVYVALSLVVFLGAAALSVDVGYMYMRKAQMQKAADASALAGAYVLSFPEGTLTAATTKARTFATSNGYTDGANRTIVSPFLVPSDASLYRVNISRSEPLFFAGVLGFKRANIGASATATYTAAVINAPVASQDYGKDFVSSSSNTIPVYNFSIFGPQAKREWGDNLSPFLLGDGKPNPQYQAPDDKNLLGTAGNTQGGYNFIFNPGTMIGDKIQIELYDPSTLKDQGSGGIDEIKGSTDYNTYNAKPNSPKTTTEYTIYSDNGTPNFFGDDKLIARTYFGGLDKRDTDSAMKWITPDGTNKASSLNPFVKDDIGSFTFDKIKDIDGKKVNYRINAVTLDGASENGFSIRGGPPHTLPHASKNTPFDPANGSSVSARGIIPINFNVDGAAEFALGYVPKEAAKGTLSINKFDTDVRPKDDSYNSVYYTCDDSSLVPTTAQKSTIAGAPANAFSGVGFSSSDTFKQDNIVLPASYQGGNWTAHYNAGKADTSTWTVAVSGSKSPGSIRLIF